MTRDGLFVGRAPSGDDVVLAPRELTTHAFAVGMTGSGKTGLCAVLVEELLGRGVPVIAVDPKGDIGNLLLACDPDRAEEFQPWLGSTEQAQRAAENTKRGLSEAGLSAEDVRRWRAGHRARIFTPGSSSGTPVNVLGSLAPPPASDAETRSDAIDAIARTLLGLLRIDADPIRSREYITLFRIIEATWNGDRTLELSELIRQISDPPFDSVGALPVESFFPKKARAELALAMNGLIASPRFEAWRTGAPLDVDAMLRSPDGKPMLSVFHTAHLEDDERLFATTLLLDRVKAWTRSQPGTGELRAVLYIDEIYGYFPPHPFDPPTKKPLLTLLKQARAFGLGVVLATQNPVDLDYKGLSNIGTWFVGRLQTDEDKARIRDGLRGAAVAAGKTFAEIDTLLAGVQQRVFLHHSIHRPAPQLLKTRWAYSLLRGPLSREEIARLAHSPQSTDTKPEVAPPSAVPSTPVSAPKGLPAVDASLTPMFPHVPGELSPHVWLKFALRYKVARSSSEERIYCFAFPLAETPSIGEALERTPRLVDETELGDSPPQGSTWRTGPRWLGEANAVKLTRVVRERLGSKLETKLYFDPDSKLLSRPEESPSAFAARIASNHQASHETGDLEQKLARKRLELTQAQEQLSDRQREKWASIGMAAVNNLGLVLGNKRRVTGVTSVLSKNRMEDTAESRVELLQNEIAALEQKLAHVKIVDTSRFEERTLVPTNKDWSLLRIAIAFLPAA